MNVQEAANRFGKIANDLKGQDNALIMARIGVTAMSKIKQRINETGTNAEGTKYKPYSTKPMLTNCSTMILSACNKVAGSKAKRKELDWVTIKGHKLFELPGGYKQYRELMGRQTQYVDFNVTGQMWADINVISNQSDHQRGTVIIGAKSEDNKKKLEGNTKRRGDILDLSNKEIGELKESYNLGVLQIFKDNGL